MNEFIETLDLIKLEIEQCEEEIKEESDFSFFKVHEKDIYYLNQIDQIISKYRNKIERLKQ